MSYEIPNRLFVLSSQIDDNAKQLNLAT